MAAIGAGVQVVGQAGVQAGVAAHVNAGVAAGGGGGVMASSRHAGRVVLRSHDPDL